MKLQSHNFGFEGNLPSNRMGAKIKTSAKLFDVLSSGIYTDPILAPIRELSCNAYDAHVDAGCREVPFKITVPNYLEPTFAVEDFGTGIPPEGFSDIFYTYGASTKTDSDAFIGALGLGSKSPFAYTKSSFLVRNRYNGTEYSYFCFINENGEPDGSLVGEQETAEPNGVRVEFAVRTDDIWTFKSRLMNFFKYWQGTMPVFEGDDDLRIEAPVKVLEGTNWYLEGGQQHRLKHAIAMMGNVPYKIEAGSIPNLPESLKLIATNPFVITVPMGSLNFAASREGLKYDEMTSKAIIQELAKVKNELSMVFTTQINQATTKIDFIKNFGVTLKEFKTTFSHDRYTSSGNTDLDIYADLLLGKRPLDCIEFDQCLYVIKELAESNFNFTVKGHQSFGLIKSGTRGKSSKLWMNPVTTLVYTAVEDIDQADFYADIDFTKTKIDLYDTDILNKGSAYNFSWRDVTSVKKKNKMMADRVLTVSESFDAVTEHVIKINPSQKTVFVINDVGSSGESRFKLLAQRTHENYFLAQFNMKVSSVAEVNAELVAFTNDYLRGAEIVLLSTLPDHRAPIQKVKAEAGTMKIRYRVYKQAVGHLGFSVLNTNVQISTSREMSLVSAKYKEDVFKVDDLLKMDQVLYVVKRRSMDNLYETVHSLQASIVVANRDCFSMANHLGFFNGAYTGTELNVLILNEGQVNWLLKRKVKLVTIRETIKTKINELEKAEGFKSAVEQMALYNGVEILRNFCYLLGSSYIETLNDKAEDDRTDFEQHLIQFAKLRAESETKAAKESYAKLALLDYVNGTHTNTKANNIASQVHDTYTLLKHINLSKNSIDDVMEYMAGVDKMI